jgi:hypothetical protein
MIPSGTLWIRVALVGTIWHHHIAENSIRHTHIESSESNSFKLDLDYHSKFCVNSYIPSKRMLLPWLEAEHTASCNPRIHHSSYSDWVFWKKVYQIRSWIWTFRPNPPAILRYLQMKNRRFGGTCLLHYHGDMNRRARNNVSSNLQPTHAAQKYY